MGGSEGSNSSPPVDVQPGGGTYPVDMFGNAYNPEWNSSQFYSGIGKGFQQAGAGLMGGSVPNFITSQAGPTALKYDPATPAGLIPMTQGNDIIDALKRLLSGQDSLSGLGGY